MKKFTILLTIVILVVATVLSGCGNSAQKYFKYDMEKYITISDFKTEIDGLRICDNKSFELSHNPIVMPLALTKGLEFDNVIVYDKDGAFSGEENKKYLYMASTRALHRLTIFAIN